MTFNFEGAVESSSIVHFGLPRPVLVAVQPFGVAPTASVSKLAVMSAMALTSIRQRNVAAVSIPFIMDSVVQRLAIERTKVPACPCGPAGNQSNSREF